MRFKIIFLAISTFTVNTIVAQVPHDFNVSSNGTAERVARFKVKDDARDFLEITNSTNHSGKFIPSIWGHQQSDNRYVLRHFASTTSTYDSGNIPLMVFRAELRNAVNLNAPSGGTFPWGTSAKNVVNRPVFAWENGNTQLMTLRANGNLGLGTTSPTAKLHTNGSVRFQNLPNGKQPTYMLGTDASGNVREYPVSTSGGGGADSDWLKTNGTKPTSINDYIYTNGRVGVGVSSPSATLHTKGTLRFENLPTSLQNPSFLLGVDANGNVTKYKQLLIILNQMEKTFQRQQSQITLLQNKLSDVNKRSHNDNLLDRNRTRFSTNYPNSFESSTDIDYFIAKGVKNASIVIYNTEGSTIKTFQLTEREQKSQLNIEKEGLKSGVYFYSLIADDIVMGTKKMIVK